jgi:hypothetical protein
VQGFFEVFSWLGGRTKSVFSFLEDEKTGFWSVAAMAGRNPNGTRGPEAKG